MIAEEIRHLNPTKKDLKWFGVIIGVFLCIIVFLMLRKGNFHLILLLISSFFIVVALLRPFLLNPFYKVWMSLALVMGWIMSRIILTVLFLTLITVLASIIRLLKKDFVASKIEPKLKTYWLDKKKAVKSKESYLKQF